MGFRRCGAALVIAMSHDLWGQAFYSDLAIAIRFTLRVLLRLALRQTQDFMRSIDKLMGLNLMVPDDSTLSPRWKDLKFAQN